VKRKIRGAHPSVQSSTAFFRLIDEVLSSAEQDEAIKTKKKFKLVRLNQYEITSFKISLPGKARILHLAEIEILQAGKNIVKKAQASMSSVFANYSVDKLSDGNKKNFCHT